MDIAIFKVLKLLLTKSLCEKNVSWFHGFSTNFKVFPTNFISVVLSPNVLYAKLKLLSFLQDCERFPRLCNECKTFLPCIATFAVPLAMHR